MKAMKGVKGNSVSLWFPRAVRCGPPPSPAAGSFGSVLARPRVFFHPFLAALHALHGLHGEDDGGKSTMKTMKTMKGKEQPPRS